MNHRHMSIDVVQAILSLVLFACPLGAAEFRPVAVWTDAECYSNPPGKYAAEKMIDGDLGTYACLLDDTRTGKDTTVCPPEAAPPVTATFVLDLGSERTVSGMRFVARNAWVYVLAKNVSVFACADAQGLGATRPLAAKQELPATSNSNSALVEWPQCMTRYLKVRVNDSYQQRYPGPWMSEAQLPWCRKVGLPTAGDGRNLNTQIAEISCFDARPADFPVKNPPDVAMPRQRLERDWLYQDAGLDIAHVFTSSNGGEKERAMVQSVLACVPAGDSAVSSLRQRLDQLVRERVAACDPRWRSLYFEACAARRKTRLQAFRKRPAKAGEAK